MINSKHRLFAALAAAAIFLAACGGGGSSSSPAPNPDPDPDPGGGSGGITGTGFAVGPITGFGSVIVNGVKYETESAEFDDDGVSGTQDDFAVGQYVVVTGTIDDSTSGTAETVSFDDNVEGPVSSVDDTGLTPFIVVLGQTVFVTPTTSFDDSCPGSLAGLLDVAAVEVSGPVMGDGSTEATRIECKAVLGEMEVTGVVSNLDTDAMTFQINALVVDYGTVPALVDNFPTVGVINDGDPVEAKGNTVDAVSGQLIATRVEYKGGRFANDDGVHAEIEGFITRFVSSTDFDVSGIRVRTDASTTYEGGAVGDLGPNLKVEVEGEFNGGVLEAYKVEFKQGTNIRVVGLIDGVSGNTVTVLNIPIVTDGLTTRFEDKSEANRDPLLVTHLGTGDYIEVRGQEFPAGSGEIAAVLLERDDPRDRTELRGFVEADSVVRPRLTVLGVTIETDDFTVYRNVNDAPMLADDFWLAVSAGSLVDARGSEEALSTLLAEELQLEAE